MFNSLHEFNIHSHAELLEIPPLSGIVYICKKKGSVRRTKKER